MSPTPEERAKHVNSRMSAPMIPSETEMSTSNFQAFIKHMSSTDTCLTLIVRNVNV